jgi:hypothetical protein
VSEFATNKYVGNPQNDYDTVFKFSLILNFPLTNDDNNKHLQTMCKYSLDLVNFFVQRNWVTQIKKKGL